MIYIILYYNFYTAGLTKVFFVGVHRINFTHALSTSGAIVKQETPLWSATHLTQTITTYPIGLFDKTSNTILPGQGTNVQYQAVCKIWV